GNCRAKVVTLLQCLERDVVMMTDDAVLSDPIQAWHLWVLAKDEGLRSSVSEGLLSVNLRVALARGPS
ncbi:MAG TPA: hypothetical protein VK196_20310, partial [Magnetospirillum sp.]|nr:hypothetical protein [Magnetospirillum sp.]